MGPGPGCKGYASASCSYDYDALDTNANSINAVSWRIPVPANTTACSGTQIRITIGSSSTNDTIVSGTSVGERNGTTDDFSAAPTRITWATGNNGVTVTAGNTATSDWINYTWTTGNAHLIHIYMADAGAQNWRRKASGTITAYYTDPEGSDNTLTQTVSTTGSTANIPLIMKIEVK